MKKLPYIFDLYFDCKTEQSVRKEIRLLKRTIRMKTKRLNDLQEMWEKYQKGLMNGQEE